MRIKLTFRREVTWVEFPDDICVSVALALHPIIERQSDHDLQLPHVDTQSLETLTILVNGENIRYRQGLETELSDGDELHIIPNISGG